MPAGHPPAESRFPRGPTRGGFCVRPKRCALPLGGRPQARDVNRLDRLRRRAFVSRSAGGSRACRAGPSTLALRRPTPRSLARRGPSRRQPSASFARISFERILAHDDAEVVLGLARRPSGSTSLKPCLLRARSTGGRHRARGRRSRRDALASAPRTRVRARRRVRCRDGRAPPHRGDELGEPACFRGTGRQARVGSRTPDARRSCDQDLVPSTSRNPSSKSERPSRSSRSAPRSTSAATAAGSLHPPRAAGPLPRVPPRHRRGADSFNTAGMPSSHVASATKASVESR